ncbi:MAG: hypothetical protein ABR878_06940 [Roseiarcus sp.]|jgi:hypothetical protein
MASWIFLLSLKRAALADVLGFDGHELIDCQFRVKSGEAAVGLAQPGAIERGADASPIGETRLRAPRGAAGRRCGRSAELVQTIEALDRQSSTFFCSAP